MNRKQRRTLNARKIKMSETSLPPTDAAEEAIKVKYTQLCSQAGDLQVRINELHGALQTTHEAIGKLKADYAASKQPKPEVVNESPKT